MPLQNNNGSIRLYFTYGGHLYSMSKLGNWNDPIARNTATQILTGIRNDISLGKFACKNNQELFTQYHPLSELINTQAKIRSSADCLSLVEARLASLELRDRNLHQVRNWLIQYGIPIKSVDGANNFWNWLQFKSNGKAKTINRYLEALKPVCEYFRDIPKLKVSQPVEDIPFSKDEIRRIIDTTFEHFYEYSSFIKFLFATGCRPNEATAIKWSDLDFQRKTITIREAIGFDKDGHKIAKSTKTGAVRTFPMSATVYAMLKTHELNSASSLSCSPVFLTPDNAIIDIRNFRARVWVKLLELANVPYRRPYNTRHTFISHYLSEYKDFQKCAAITHGTKSGVQTLIKHYAHLVNDIETLDLWNE